MALPEAWSIKSRAHQCAITEKKFTANEEFFTAIYPDPETGGYLRTDYSAAAWHTLPAYSPAPFSFWKSIYEPPVHDEKPQVMEKQSAEHLLARLIEDDQVHTENARYILAIMLERQKLLIETDSQPTANGILRIYQHRKSGEIFIILDPNIPLYKIDKIQTQVAELLDSNSPPSPFP